MLRGKEIMFEGGKVCDGESMGRKWPIEFTIKSIDLNTSTSTKTHCQKT